MSEEERSQRSATQNDRIREESFSQWLARPQTMIGLSAVLLSVCGLFVATYEATLLRQHQRASVWPHVEVTASLTAERVRLMVQNTGVGPARVRAAAVTVDGQRQDSWDDVIRTTLEEPGTVNAYHSLINGRVLPSGFPEETIFTLAVDDGGAASALVPALRREILEGSLDVELCYCSVYDECWTASMQDVIKRLRGVEALRSRQTDSCLDMPVSAI